jgi:hypothetical protein
VFILLEFPSPSRRIFIGSHSLPPLWFAVSVLHFPELQIKQLKEGTFVHQAKYTKDIVRKFKMEDSKAMATPMSTTTALDADEEGEHVD